MIDYFCSGTQLVWYVEPVKKTVEVFTAADQSTVLQESDTLSGDPVLPGFTLALTDLFAQF